MGIQRNGDVQNDPKKLKSAQKNFNTANMETKNVMMRALKFVSTAKCNLDETR